MILRKEWTKFSHLQLNSRIDSYLTLVEQLAKEKADLFLNSYKHLMC